MLSNAQEGRQEGSLQPVAPALQSNSATPPRCGPRFARALTYAHQLHHTQVRKGSGIPYLSHLLAVAATALEHGADEDEAIAALLHDSLEDGPRNTGIPRSQIEQQLSDQFGDKVLQIVLGCTDTNSDSSAKEPQEQCSPDGEAETQGDPRTTSRLREQESWWVRKEAYLQHLEQLVREDAHPLASSILLVANADKLHNARSILRDWQQLGDAVWERFSAGKQGSLWYYRRLAEIFMQRPSPLARELQQTVQTLLQAA
ncbi:HD domain-containing protein [Thermostichus vulcanus]|uniref:HD domain-containing protein n=1 Tax=Thermostichus vulcanus str. 'Rupite' TaxID=2813851 RepID=A0ABT0C9G1_THEVL|nr:HD domain-containing protein [Thermostichus vulcanus]MCJ2542419.1 HD domain-containing protein [Thermostichus vulcanus str. 'Rupite']